MLAAAGSVVDGDVNDTNAAFDPNNTLQTAQDIPSPVSVGGYVNQPGSGAAGRSRLSGDESDIYRVSLVANQQITLSIGDISGINDLDLFLGDADGNLLDSSEGVGSSEVLVSPVTGTFLIEVFAYAGASNYVLTIGQGSTVPAGTLSVMDEFVARESVVRFDDAAVAKAGNASELAALASAAGLHGKAGAAGREMLLGAGNAALAPAAAVADGQTAVLVQAAGIDAGKIETIRQVKALRRRPDVRYADPNYVIRPLLTPNDSFYPLQWHYPLINLPQAWDITTGDNSVVVAVIDTGAILSHPDLQGRLVQGYDFVLDPSNALDGDGIDDNPADPGGSLLSGRSVFHGTHVAGTIGAASNNISGVSGVSWGASIMPLRALGAQGGTSYDVMQAVRYAAGLENDSGTVPAQRADVINLSLGGYASSLAEQQLVTEARNAGVIIVAAAGNDNSSAPFYPASYNGVVSVSAVDISRGKAPYSNFGSAIDVAAPGGNSSQDINGDGNPDGVLSTAGDESSGSIQPDYRFLNGTSMAAPHVAGVAALMKTVNPGLTPAIFDNLLASGQLTEDLGAPGRDDVFGHGLIDAHRAVVSAGGADIEAVLVASPGALNYGSVITDLQLLFGNGGGGELTIDAPTDDAAWLTVTADSVDAGNIGTYIASVDRAGLADGTYAATITVTSSANTVSLPVVMQVSSTAAAADAGYQYILLVDTLTGETVDAVESSAVNGRYSYSFSEVPAGSYWIFSGSDSNNDGFICDEGESCGSFLTLTQPTDINLDADLSLDDFPTSWVAGFAGQSAAPDATERQPRSRTAEDSGLPQLAR